MLASLAFWAVALVLESPNHRIAARHSRATSVRCQFQGGYSPETGGLSTLTSERPDGSHGTGYRFMPLSTMPKDSAPALLSIAGAYPGLTGAQLLAPTALPFAPAGRWNYHVLSGEVCSRTWTCADIHM